MADKKYMEEIKKMNEKLDVVEGIRPDIVQEALRRYHVHIYLVSAKAELDVLAVNPEDIGRQVRAMRADLKFSDKDLNQELPNRRLITWWDISEDTPEYKRTKSDQQIVKIEDIEALGRLTDKLEGLLNRNHPNIAKATVTHMKKILEIYRIPEGVK